MPKPIRVQLSRKKGWRLPPNTVVVSRPTKWGNPFVVGRDGDRKACVSAYRKWIRGRITAGQLAELRGKNLACWCPLDGPCHADVLLQLANE